MMEARLLTTPLAAAHNNTTTLEDCLHGDDAFKHRAYTATYLLVLPLGLICNAGALLLFLLTPHCRSSAPCVVMMNLALSDAGFSLTLALRLAYYFRGGVWDFSDWLCRLCCYAFYVNLYTSILFLTLLSALRWLAVAQPLRHRSLATPTRTLLACLGVWLFVGGASSPFLSSGITSRSGLPRCFEPSAPASWRRVLIVNYVGLAVGFVLPFLTILCCYGDVVRRLAAPPALRANRRRGGRGGDSRRRSVRLVSAVTLTFLSCFLPYHLLRALHLHAVCRRWDCRLLVALQRAVAVTLCLAASNSAVNPLLYYYCAGTFRRNLGDLSRRLGAWIHPAPGSTRGGRSGSGLGSTRTSVQLARVDQGPGPPPPCLSI